MNGIPGDGSPLPDGVPASGKAAAVVSGKGRLRAEVSATVLACLTISLMLSPSLASAQYQWKDADGKMVFSDRPPPGGSGAKQIIRQPPKPAAPSPALEPSPTPGGSSGTSTAGAAPAPGSGAAPATATERWEARQKIRDEQAQAEATRQQELALKQRQASNCARLKSYRAQLETGSRIAVTGADGQREIMDDRQRELEMRQVAQDIRETCDRPQGQATATSGTSSTSASNPGTAGGPARNNALSPPPATSTVGPASQSTQPRTQQLRSP